jgi:hypothetical protein
MVKSTDEAKELCAKYGVKLSDHKTVIVTANNSIYLSDNIDPADTSEKFYLKGGTISIKAEKEDSPEKPVSSEGELTEEDIEKQIEEEEKAKGKKAKK